jgi:hypothetical protein
MPARWRAEDVARFELHYLLHCYQGFRMDEQACIHCVAQMRRIMGFAGWPHS